MPASIAVVNAGAPMSAEVRAKLLAHTGNRAIFM
jgi:hypothetical protein